MYILTLCTISSMYIFFYFFFIFQLWQNIKQLRLSLCLKKLTESHSNLPLDTLQITFVVIFLGSDIIDTFMRQLRILYRKEYIEDERKDANKLVSYNVNIDIQSLISSMMTLQIDYDDDQTIVRA